MIRRSMSEIYEVKEMKCANCKHSKIKGRRTPESPCYSGAAQLCLETRKRLDSRNDFDRGVRWVNRSRYTSYELFEPWYSEPPLFTDKDFFV